MNNTWTIILLEAVLFLKIGNATGQTNDAPPVFSWNISLREKRKPKDPSFRILAPESGDATDRLDVALYYHPVPADRSVADFVRLPHPAANPGILGVLMKPTPSRLLGLFDFTAPLTENELHPRSWRAMTGERALPHAFQDAKTMEPEGALFSSGGN